MTPIKSKNKESSKDVLPCPGKRLKIARESKGMDVTQAAEQLHLSRAMVNALEAEDYDKLPARVFVRGYYKNYARLMELPTAAILREFDDRCPDGNIHAAPPVIARSARAEVHSSNRLVRLITWLVIITLIAMLVVWWQGYLGWPSKSLNVSEEMEHDRIYDKQEPSTIVELDTADSREMDEDVIPAIPEPKLAAEESRPMSESANQDTTEVVPTVVEYQSVQPPVIAEIRVPVRPELTVMFSGECWVDIRDSTREFKLFGKMHDGDMRKLGGEPPYKMIFGNYPVAKLLVDGKPYDLSAHAKGNTAKFTFDPVTAVTR